MSVRDVIHQLCLQFPGGYDAMAVAVGVSTGAMLRQKVLGHKGARLDIDEALMIQSASDNHQVIEALARECNGQFVYVPAASAVDRVDIGRALSELSIRTGALAQTFSESVRDDELDLIERRALEAGARAVGECAMSFAALCVAVYGNADAQGAGDDGTA
ncbi:hypothetical protein N8I74_10980 [Chitiniphilus purpureus]|uniref:Uncharacterized protein n=1 Tax=Chitiniphilus purpureus TaxID=2981137 RepID=A0ABY6DHM1_9NEIS|nr:phage regulatory CII family protein [Chitiniphilus sp. CD1]UXY13845.1 hypothetical protein N8I74_10980 [Chitiniphilus sp. CD1]